jgi:outer membrane protein TolC
LDASAVNSGANPITWSAGFSFDLPIDRVPERNAYRSSLIALEVARRDEQEMSDTLRADLRDEMRELGNTKKSYQIQLNAVELARQRVESTELSLSAGRSDTRAALNARRSLVSAQNSATSALVEHLLSRLSLFNQLELLRIGPQGFELETSALTGTESQG